MPEQLAERERWRHEQARRPAMAKAASRKRKSKSKIVSKTALKTAKARARTARRGPPARKVRRWSQRVTEQSNALDLDSGVFKQRSPKKIAASLKRSALRSRRRKSSAYRSAISMLTFYINRAGRTLPAARKRVLNQAKDELRAQFGRA
jgi:hypothetical protein